MMDLTILIVARDAEATIERCLRSALAQGDCSLLLVDDQSSDATVSRARALAGARLAVVRVPEHRTLGYARQIGLQALGTRYGMLLDADDELLPGRAQRLCSVLAESGCDMVADELLLWDGERDSLIREMGIPAFLGDEDRACRLFERNYLPGIGQIAFQVERIQKIGYNESLHGGEDADLVFRALLAGLRLRLVRSAGYRMYHSSGSISRNLTNQNNNLARSLRQHNIEQVAALYRSAGFGEPLIGWMRVMLSVFRQEYVEAEQYLDTLYPNGQVSEQILEPDGPCPLPESWRYPFCKGTLRLNGGDWESARSYLEKAASTKANAETLNNLGVAIAAAGNLPRARAHFAQALALYPEYWDARRNLDSQQPNCLTTLPLRRDRSRDLYG